MATETVYALFPSVGDAERAIGALMDHGINSSNIGVIARQPAEQDEAERVRAGFTRVTDTADAALGEPVAAYEPRPATMPPAAIGDTVVPTSSIDTPDNVETVGKEGITTTTAADAAAGAGIGTGIGLIAGLLAGAVSLVVPGVGIVLAAGAVTAALGATVAATAAGAIAGGVAGYLRDMGMNDVAADSYADRVSQGDYLIAVNVDTSDYDNVRRLLLKYNASGVDIEVNAAGENVRRAWGNDPALVEYLHQRSSRPAPASATFGAPTPVRRIVAEEPDGTPIIPAREVEEAPTGRWLNGGETPSESEAALDHDAEVDDELHTR
jgi:hypothetical protein